MVHAPLVQHEGGVEDYQDDNLPRLLEKHFPERIPPTERK
jgi:hypothetical protein